MTLDTAPAVSHRQRAADLIALGKFDRVAHEARRALGRNPEDAEAHRLLAWALWAKGENSRAQFAAQTYEFSLACGWGSDASHRC